jgi:hypothetical protein
MRHITAGHLEANEKQPPGRNLLILHSQYDKPSHCF